MVGIRDLGRYGAGRSGIFVKYFTSQRQLAQVVPQVERDLRDAGESRVSVGARFITPVRRSVCPVSVYDDVQRFVTC
jgi:hypothetical protein